MLKETLIVPRGIYYLSDWEAFSLPITPAIINKQITGCGFTEWCIRNDINLVLCSPRKILLENKTEQHPGEVLYVRNELEIPTMVDEDLNKAFNKSSDIKVKVLTEEQVEQAQRTISRMKKDVQDYYYNTTGSGRPCKILVTYDSFRHVKDALGDKIKDFYIIVDEFQSIFTDSRFKSDTEMEFIEQIKKLNKVSYVSATPYMDKYLDQLEEFKNLPYYELDWAKEEPNRVIKPEIDAKPCDSIISIAKDFIQSYLDGDYQKYCYYDCFGNIQEIESKELVIYVNSVKNICDIITKCNLTYSNTNVLCANYQENQKKIRKAFGLKRKEEGGIGKVPKRGEPHKMFTLCTRTVYLGADFYSPCARTLVLSDANIDCLAVDIRLDLPQILGRQRLVENPWKNRAEFYYKTYKDKSGKDLDFQDLMNLVKEKKDKSEKLLSAFKKVNFEEQIELAEVYQDRALTRKYKKDYVAVNKHKESMLVPVFNSLVMISEIRSYEIQRIIYEDRFSVASSIKCENNLVLSNEDIYEFLNNFNKLIHFTDKMKYLCEFGINLDNDTLSFILGQIKIDYGNYYTILGPEKIKSLSYQKSKLDIEYSKLVNNQEHSSVLIEELKSVFLLNKKYSLSMIKNTLGIIYSSLGILTTPKASDLEKYFEVKLVYMTDKETKKREKGYLIIKVK